MAGSSGAVRACAAYVELLVRDSALYKAMDRAAARVKHFGGQMAKAGAAMSAAGMGVAGPLGLMSKMAVGDGAAIDQMAKSLGTTAEELTAFTSVAGKSGVETAKLAGFLSGLPDALSRMADGSGDSSEMLRRLGINARELINLPFNEQMALLAQAVSEVTNPIDRARVATELFGEAGRDLLPLLSQGGKAYKAMADEAKASGDVMSSEKAEAAAASQRALTAAYEEARAAAVEMGQSLLPSVETVEKMKGQFLGAATAVREFIRAHRDTVAAVAAVSVGVVGLGTVVVAFGGVAAGVATAVTAMVAAVTGVISAAATAVYAILSPLGLIAVAIAAAAAAAAALGVAVVAAVLVFTDAGSRACASLGEAFGALADTFGQAWGGVVVAVRAVNLEAAFGVATSTLDLMLKRAVVKMTQAWTDFKAYFVDAWNDGMMLIRLGMESASTSIALVMVDILDTIAKRFSKTFNAIVDGAAKVAEALGALDTASAIRSAKDMLKLDMGGCRRPSARTTTRRRWGFSRAARRNRTPRTSPAGTTWRARGATWPRRRRRSPTPSPRRPRPGRRRSGSGPTRPAPPARRPTRVPPGRSSASNCPRSPAARRRVTARRSPRRRSRAGSCARPRRRTKS